MSVKCFEPEDLGQVLSLPDTDPRARHLRECPRCRSLVRAFREFSEPTDDVPPGADLAVARAKLTESVDEAIRADRSRPSTVRRESPTRSIWSILISRPAWAAAALAVVVIGTIWLVRPTEKEAEPLLRGPGDLAAESFGTLEARKIGDSWTVSWHPVPEAESYEVRFFSAGLEELARESTTSASLTLAPGRLEGWAAGGNVVHWRVTALRHGDPIRSSSVATLTAP